MDSKLIYIFLAVALDGLAGLTGGLLPTEFVHRHIATLLSFAAGTLVGTAFIELLPEALSSSVPAHEVMLACLAGFIIFHAVESFLGSHAAGQSGHKHSSTGPMILIGDALHNATDGVAIATAFMADVRAGVATTIAVIVHELPQEIGDYAILIAQGYSRRRALFLLFLVQLTALIGAIGALWWTSASTYASPFLLALASGGFIYIAAADLLPELQKHKSNAGPFAKILSFVLGLTLVAVLALVLS